MLMAIEAHEKFTKTIEDKLRENDFVIQDEIDIESKLNFNSLASQNDNSSTESITKLEAPDPNLTDLNQSDKTSNVFYNVEFLEDDDTHSENIDSVEIESQKSNEFLDDEQQIDDEFQYFTTYETMIIKDGDDENSNEIDDDLIENNNDMEEILRNEREKEVLLEETKQSINEYEKNQPRQCHKCDVIFPNSKEFKSHWNSEHAPVYVFNCEDCGKKFKSQDIYESHMNVHKGLPAFT